MGWQGWNRIFAVSSCLAAAGGVTCLAILYNLLVPRGSLLAFLAAAVPLGCAVVAVVLGFMWTCEKCEEYLSRRAERWFGARAVQQSAMGDNSLPFRGNGIEDDCGRAARVSLAGPATSRGVDGDDSTVSANGSPAGQATAASRRAS
jgi:hypothetical protein